MEQNIQQDDRIMLRYKFCAFFDLKPKVNLYNGSPVFIAIKITPHPLFSLRADID